MRANANDLRGSVPHDQTGTSVSRQVTASVELEKVRTRKLFDSFRTYVATSAQHGVLGRATPTQLSTAPHSVSNVDQLVQDLHGYSLVSILAALIETRLVLFCSALRKEHSLTVRLDDMKGSFVERVRDYLRLHLGASPPRDLWLWVDDVMRVRQIVGESCGRLDAPSRRDRRDMAQLAHRRNGLELITDRDLLGFMPRHGADPEPTLRVRPEFCLEAITAARGLFGYLYQSRGWAVDQTEKPEQH